MDKKNDKYRHGQEGMKPDKTCHYNNKEGTTAKKATMPGQMYVPKKVSNEGTFAELKK
jgi:hypothetical protein